MNPRLRSLTALLALIGFSALFAENLLAMSCMPADAVGSGAMEMAGMMHNDVDHPAPATSDHAPDPSTPEQCALAMAAGACVVPVSVVPATSSIGLPELARQTTPPLAVDAADEMIVRTPFHPPRI